MMFCEYNGLYPLILHLQLHETADLSCVVLFPEAQRVYDFKAAAESGSDLAAIGALMSASHQSCSGLYECSHPDVDKLVELAKKHGALGARCSAALFS